MVYVVNDCLKVVSSRSGNNYVLSTCIDMSLSFVFGCVETCALKNYVYTDLSPWKLCSVSLSIDFDLFSVYCDGILACCYFISKSISSCVESYFNK